MQINIEDPCQKASWKEMDKIHHQCRFCAQCEREDFTNKSDQEIARIIEATPHLCGRFTKEQLEKDYRTNKISLLPKVAWTSALAGVLVAYTAKGNESQELMTAPVYQQLSYKSEGRQLDKQVTTHDSTKVERVFRGILLDDEGLLVVSGTVLIKGTSIGVVTDKDGRFVLKTNQQGSLVLTFIFIGMKTVEVDVAEDQDTLTLEVRFEETEMIMGEIVVANDYKFPSPKWFWHKIKRFPRWITSPFRKHH